MIPHVKTLQADYTVENSLFLITDIDIMNRHTMRLVNLSSVQPNYPHIYDSSILISDFLESLHMYVTEKNGIERVPMHLDAMTRLDNFLREIRYVIADNNNDLAHLDNCITTSPNLYQLIISIGVMVALNHLLGQAPAQDMVCA